MNIKPIPGNLSATAASAFYTDANILSNATTEFYYIVTAEGPTLLMGESDFTPAIASTEFKSETMESDSLSMSFYMNPAWIEGPNPDKPAQNEPELVPPTWYGTLSPLPDHLQIKQ